MRFSTEDFLSKCDQVRFTKEIVLGKLHYLCGDNYDQVRFCLVSAFQCYILVLTVKLILKEDICTWGKLFLKSDNNYTCHGGKMEWIQMLKKIPVPP